jgi:hypothetical protein
MKQTLDGIDLFIPGILFSICEQTYNLLQIKLCLKIAFSLIFLPRPTRNFDKWRLPIRPTTPSARMKAIMTEFMSADGRFRIQI